MRVRHNGTLSPTRFPSNRATNQPMNEPTPSTPTQSELIVNLAKDGGRTVMHGGDPYEDDVERDVPPPPASSAGERRL